MGSHESGFTVMTRIWFSSSVQLLEYMHLCLERSWIYSGWISIFKAGLFYHYQDYNICKYLYSNMTPLKLIIFHFLFSSAARVDEHGQFKVG